MRSASSGGVSVDLDLNVNLNLATLTSTKVTRDTSELRRSLRAYEEAR